MSTKLFFYLTPFGIVQPRSVLKEAITAWLTSETGLNRTNCSVEELTMPEDHKEDLTVRKVTHAEQARWRRMNCAICGERIIPNDDSLIAPQGENKLPHFYHTDCYHKSDRK